MSNSKKGGNDEEDNDVASTRAHCDCASDSATGTAAASSSGSSSAPRVQSIATIPPPAARSWALKLESNRKRRSLFGRSYSDAAARRPPPRTLPRTAAAAATAPAAAAGGCSGTPAANIKHTDDASDARRPSTAPAQTSGGARRSKVEPLEQLRNSLFLSVCRKRRTQQHQQQKQSLLQQPQPVGLTNNDVNSSANRDLQLMKDDPTAAVRTRPDTRRGPSCNSPREHFKSGAQYYRHLKKNSISPPFAFEHIAHTAKEQLHGVKSVDKSDLTAQFWAVTRSQRPRHSLRGIQADDLTLRRRSMAFGYANNRSRPVSLEAARRASAAPAVHRPSASSNNVIGLRKDSNTLGLARERQGTRDSNVQLSQHPAWRSSKKSTAVPDTSVQRNSTNASGIPVSRPDASPKPAQHLTQHPAPRTRLSLGVSPGTEQMRDIPERVSSIQHKRSTSVLPPLPEQAALSPDATWEDDVDFLYEQEAEATCEFDWTTAPALHKLAPTHGGDEIRDSVWSTPPMTHAFGPAFPHQSLQAGVSSHDFVEQQHRRGSSVGHRDFLAARGSNLPPLADISSPPIVQITPDTNDGNLPSPIAKMSLDGDLASKPNTLNLSALPQSNLDELSDPESTRTGGSKHRKSSSFGSSGSSARSTKSTSDNRWSLASFAAVPELLYSHRRNKTSISKMRISAPLEPLPQGPDSEFENPRDGHNLVIPDQQQQQQQHRHRQQQSLPHAPLSMRRPQTPGDRAALQAAGRASQRGRTLATERYPSHSIRRYQEASMLGNGPDWI